MGQRNAARAGVGLSGLLGHLRDQNAEQSLIPLPMRGKVFSS
jgi:hypothetical protein